MQEHHFSLPQRETEKRGNDIEKMRDELRYDGLYASQKSERRTCSSIIVYTYPRIWALSMKVFWSFPVFPGWQENDKFTAG